jgi:phosphate:Na+ symporter
MVLLNIVGGIALILFGIRFLRKGLERLLGFGLHAWLKRMSQRPWRAAIAGAGFGTVAPSSTAQTLLTLQLVKAGELSREGALAFLLGANAGITVTVQLIALRVFDYYSLFLVAGFLGFQFFRSERIRGSGQSLLGLGLIFLAMTIISDAARVLAADPEFTTVLDLLQNHRLLLMLFAAVFTLSAQSSTAVIGLGLAFAATGKASLELLVPIVLGANLGIGITSLFAGYATAAGRALAVANLAVKGLLIAAALIFFSRLVAALGATPGDVARQAANLHTAFSLIAVVVGVAFGGLLGKWLDKVMKPTLAEETAVRPVATHLDPTSLSVPVFALANATRETLLLGDEVRSMLEGAWRAFNKPSLELARGVQKHDDRVDELHTAIKHYLSQLPTDPLTPQESRLQFGLLNFASQLEGIGDIVDKTLCGAAVKQVQQPLALSDEDKADLTEFYERVMRRFDAATSVLATRDRELAREFLRQGDALKEWCIEAQKRHYQRLKNVKDTAQLEESARFIDMINAFRRISGLLNTIGHTFLLEGGEPTQS